jgi:hypothetical protein
VLADEAWARPARRRRRTALRIDPRSRWIPLLRRTR